MVAVHAPIPGVRLLAQSLEIGNSATAQTLSREDPDFDLSLIKPASVSRRVMDGEAIPDLCRRASRPGTAGEAGRTSACRVTGFSSTQITGCSGS